MIPDPDPEAAEYRRWVATPNGNIGLTIERPDLGATVLVQIGPWGPHRRLSRRGLREATKAEVEWFLSGEDGPRPTTAGEE